MVSSAIPLLSGQNFLPFLVAVTHCQTQIKRLKELRASRDEAAVKKALAAITECVKAKQGNLLELAVEAAKVRASLGEISDACEVVVGRYKAVIRSISGVYS